MTFGLDFDRTYTADPPLWQAFINVVVSRGGRIYCVTSRTDKPANRQLFHSAFGVYLSMLSGVIYCDHQPKRAAAEAAGVLIDIWIDDVPETIGARDGAEVAAVEERFHVREE